MAVILSPANATSPAVPQGGGVFKTRVSYTAASTPDGGLATPTYSTAHPNCSVLTPTGHTGHIGRNPTPMDDDVMLQVTGGVLPLIVQIDILVSCNGNVGNSLALTSIL